jgi:hypothetical protein
MARNLRNRLSNSASLIFRRIRKVKKSIQMDMVVMPVISALGRLRQKSGEFQVSLTWGGEGKRRGRREGKEREVGAREREGGTEGGREGERDRDRETHRNP